MKNRRISYRHMRYYKTKLSQKNNKILKIVTKIIDTQKY